MKKILAWLLLAAVVLGLCACDAASASPDTTEAPAEPTAAQNAAAETEAEQETQQTQAATEETESAEVEGSVFLKVSSITFSLVGESEDIYLGVVPRELITWESEDPSIVSVENGVLTANAVGTTTIRATYNDRQVSCTAGCLAQTQEELDALGFEILSKPKCLPPEVDLDTPCTYFDDAAIVGDSIAYMLVQCESKGDYLGNVTFLTRGGASMNGFVRRFQNVYFQGVQMYLEDAVAASQVKRIYMLVGSNDIASDPQRVIYFENWDIMLQRIREKSPEVEIVVISNIPQSADEAGSQGTLFQTYNNYIAEYNGMLREYCQENGCMFLDLHYYFRDHCGRMPREYNLDGYHPNTTGYAVWMTVMRYYAQYELEGGTLS